MKVLFICEGNVFRSQMAEAFLKSMVPEIEVRSAGTHVPAHWEGKQRPLGEYPEVVSEMKKLGIDISGAVSNKLTKEMLQWADRAILVGPIHAGAPEFLMKHPGLIEWGVGDPGYGYGTVAEARDIIQKKVAQLANEIAR